MTRPVHKTLVAPEIKENEHWLRKYRATQARVKKERDLVRDLLKKDKA